MAENATTTTEAPAPVLTGKAREAAMALVTQGNAVFTSLTEGSLQQVNATIELIVKLAPMLSTQLRNLRRVDGDDVGPGAFLSHIKSYVTSIGDPSFEWKLDAGTTFLAAEFVRDRKAWASYRNHVIGGGGKRQPSFTRYAAPATDTSLGGYQARFKAGHYDSMGNLTTKGEKAEEKLRKDAFAEQTISVSWFDTIDFSGVLDADASKADELAFYHKLAYWAESQLLTLEAELKTTDSGKKTVNTVRKDIQEKLLAAKSRKRTR